MPTYKRMQTTIGPPSAPADDMQGPQNGPVAVFIDEGTEVFTGILKVFLTTGVIGQSGKDSMQHWTYC